MTDAARAAKNAYRRAWYRANREKVKAEQERYWARKAEAAAEASKCGLGAQEVQEV